MGGTRWLRAAVLAYLALAPAAVVWLLARYAGQ